MTASDQLPDTPAGRQAAWFLEHYRTGGRDITVEEIGAHMRLAGDWTPQDGYDRMREDGPADFAFAQELSPYELVVRVRIDRFPERVWLATFRVDEEPPHLITKLVMTRELGEGVVLREAVPEDAPQLVELERRSPIAIGDATVAYDRGDDFFAFARLMEETHNLVIEEHGKVAAFHCGALHRVRISGTEYAAMLAHHSRVPKEHQGKGFFNALNNRVFEWYEGRMDVALAYVAVDNTRAGRLGGPGAWSVRALRGLLQCRTLAGPQAGRTATPDDAAKIVDILNRCHEREEAYLPYTAESFAARLQRAPELYSWANLWLTERAVVGVWPAGLSVIREEGGRSETVRATVLDHGFLPGADDELEQLLRAWCASLAERGTDELALMTSEGSPNHALVQRLASRIDAFDFRMGAPEPEGTAERGLYVDPVYF